MQGALSQLRSWKLDHNQEDIRGWALRDPEGHVLGTVGDLIVDTDTKRITQVVLGDGKRFSAHDVLLGENTLVLESARGAGAGAVAEQPVQTEAAGPGIAEREYSAERERAEAAEAVRASASAESASVVSEKFSEERSDVADLVIPIVEEEISVEKRKVASGGVHVERRVVEEPFDQEIRLREESVKVDRRRIDEPLSAAEADARLHEGSIEVKAKAERAVVDKHAHVVEEILVKKDSKEHVEHVRDTLRHTEVEIDELSPTSASKLEKGVKS